MSNGKRLTTLGIEKSKSRKQDYWISDDDGTRGGGRLAVRVSSGGSKLFYFRYSIGGSRKFVPIGTFTPVGRQGQFTLEQARAEARSLAELHRAPESRDVAAYLEGLKRAREAAAEQRAREAEGTAVSSPEADSYSVAALCDWYVKHLRANEKQSAGNVESLINCHVKGTEWASLPASEFTAKQATALLRKMVEKGVGRTAGKVRSALRAAYALALKAELDPTAPADLVLFGVETNPVASTAALSMFNRTRERNLAPSELGALWHALRPAANERLSVKAMRLALRLGGQRGLQLLRVRRIEDVDLEARTITIYDRKGRRSMPRVHVLPLTKEALAEVSALVGRASALKSPWLFASGDSKLGSDGLSDLAKELSTMLVTDETCLQPFQFADMRRTAETLLASLKISKDIRAQLQSHGLSGVQSRHYDRYEYMDEKREVLEIWEKYLATAARTEARRSSPKARRKAGRHLSETSEAIA